MFFVFHCRYRYVYITEAVSIFLHEAKEVKQNKHSWSYFAFI